MDPEVIFSLANRTVVAGMGYVMRDDSLGGLIYPMHAWNPKQDLSGLDIISPSIGIVLVNTGRQAPPGHSLRLREMIQFCDSHLCSTLASSCFVCGNGASPSLSLSTCPCCLSTPHSHCAEAMLPHQWPHKAFDACDNFLPGGFGPHNLCALCESVFRKDEH